MTYQVGDLIRVTCKKSWNPFNEKMAVVISHYERVLFKDCVYTLLFFHTNTVYEFAFSVLSDYSAILVSKAK